jgi:hypothetical protein
MATYRAGAFRVLKQPRPFYHADYRPSSRTGVEIVAREEEENIGTSKVRTATGAVESHRALTLALRS